MSHHDDMREIREQSRMQNPKQPEKALDGCNGYDKEMKGMAMDAVDNANTELAAVSALQEWANTDVSQLDEGEGLGDRLFSLVAGIADDNFDGEISDDEWAVMETAVNAMGDYLAAHGVAEEDIAKLVDEFDNDIAATVQAQLVESMPEDEDNMGAEADNFVFGDGSDESAMDAVYKKKLVIRKGKKQWAMKRVAGKVRLSAKQKIGIRKAHRKAFSAKAKMRRAKSMRLRSKLGI